ncbi:MAG: TRAP transporter small permease subunit [Hyphomonadaceae bacterium]|nr:TRAP transporter small permease subunit [Hyphomonadaceae bacterium]
MAGYFLMLGTGLKWLGFALSPLLLLPFLLLVIPGPLRVVANNLIRLLDRISSTMLGLAIACAVITVFAQLSVVLARYVFGLSFSWLNETVIYAFAAMFLLAAASALRDDEHVRVDILRGRYSAGMRAGIELAGIYIFLIPICLLILWSAISPSFVRSWANFEASRESDGLPIRFLFRTLIPLLAVLLIGQGLSQALKAAQVLRGHRTPEALHGQGAGA